MINKKLFDIAVIGGGMVGASLALLLARQEPAWQIVLLESLPLSEENEAQYHPSFDSRSTAISHGSAEILRELGLWEKLSQHATAIRQVHVSDAGHFMGGLIDAATYGLDAVGYVIPNAWLGRVLWSQVRAQDNIECLAPVKVQRVIPQQNGALLKVDTANENIELHCKLAVIADGGDSPLRSALGIDKTVKEYNQTAIIANVAYREPHGGVAYERFTEQGPLALLPLGDSADAQQSALVLTLPRATADEVIAMSDADFLQHLQDRFGYRLGKFEQVSKRVAYQLQLVTANEQVRSHIALVGNAAHFLHPVAGQGFNLSLRDCTCLVNSLMEGVDAGKQLGELVTLQHYVEQQRVDQTLTIEFSDRLVRLFSSDTVPLIALRHLGFLGLDLLPSIKTHFAGQTMGTAGSKFL
jgi:2-octaprenylphenol hydroxylase